MLAAIDRYIIRQLTVATLLIAVILLVVIWLGLSLQVMEHIVSRGLSMESFLSLTGLMLPRFLPVIMAVALFIAVLWTYQRLVTDSELIVLRASGLSDIGLARPAVILATLVTLGVVYVNFSLGPAAERAFKELQFLHRHDLQTLLIQTGEFKPLRDNVTIFVRSRHEGDELSGILIQDDRQPEKGVTLMAERGKLIYASDGPRVVLQQGNRQEVDRRTGRVSLLFFDRYTLDLSSMERRITDRWRDPAERSLADLFSLRAEDADERFVREFRAEAHYRIASTGQVLAVVLIALVVLLYGEFNRRGYFWRMILAALVAPSVLLGSFLLKGVITRVPPLTPLLYLTVLLPIAVGMFALAAPRRVRRRRGSADEPEPGTA